MLRKVYVILKSPYRGRRGYTPSPARLLYSLQISFRHILPLPPGFFSPLVASLPRKYPSSTFCPLDHLFLWTLMPSNTPFQNGGGCFNTQTPLGTPIVCCHGNSISWQQIRRNSCRSNYFLNFCQMFTILSLFCSLGSLSFTSVLRRTTVADPGGAPGAPLIFLIFFFRISVKFPYIYSMY